MSIVGSGQGSVAPRDILVALSGLATEVSTGPYDVTVRAVPLHDVAAAWTETTNGRIVLTPGL